MGRVANALEMMLVPLVPARISSSAPATGSRAHTPGKGVVPVISQDDAASIPTPSRPRASAKLRDVIVSLAPARARRAPTANSQALVNGL